MGQKWNSAGSAVVGSGNASQFAQWHLLVNQLEDPKHHRSQQSGTDKLGDFCKCSRCSELEGIV